VQRDGGVLHRPVENFSKHPGPQLAVGGRTGQGATGWQVYFDSNRMPHDAALVDLVFDFAPREVDRIRLLVDNPRALFERR